MKTYFTLLILVASSFGKLFSSIGDSSIVRKVDSIVLYSSSQIEIPVAAIDSFIIAEDLNLRSDSLGVYLYCDLLVMKAMFEAESGNLVKSLGLFNTVLTQSNEFEQKQYVLTFLFYAYFRYNDYLGAEKWLLAIEENIKNFNQPSALPDFLYSKMLFNLGRAAQIHYLDSLSQNYFADVKSYIKDQNTFKGYKLITQGYLVRLDESLSFDDANLLFLELRDAYQANELAPNYPFEEVGFEFYSRFNMEEAEEYFQVLFDKYMNKLDHSNTSSWTFINMDKLIRYALKNHIYRSDEIIELIQKRNEWAQANHHDLVSFKNSEFEYQLTERIQRQEFNELSESYENLYKRNKIFVFSSIVLLLSSLGLLIFIFLKKKKPSILEQEGADLKDESFQKGFEGEIEVSDFDSFVKLLLHKYPDVTNTDVKVIDLVLKGKTTQEIADDMGISPRGAESAKYRLRKKLNVEKDIDTRTFLMELGGNKFSNYE